MITQNSIMKKNNPIRNGKNIWKDTKLKENVWLSNKHKGRCLTLISHSIKCFSNKNC